MTYWERNQLLRRMGFSSYPAYLQSILWHSIRTQVLRAQPHCEGCRGRATEVHHNFYCEANLKGRNLNGLHSLCSLCHDLIEFHEGQKILDHDEINRRFLLLKRMGYADARLRLTGKFLPGKARPLRSKGETRRATDTLVTACQAVHPAKEYRSKWQARKE